MEFDGDNGRGRWIADSSWDAYSDGNRDPDGYRHSYSSTNGCSHRHGYRCTNSYSNAHNSIHADTDPNSYFYVSTNDDANAHAC